MDRRKTATCTDLDLLNRLESLSFLSPLALNDLVSRLNPANFKRGALILPEESLAAGVHVLLKGVARITCMNPAGQRVTIALLAPGPIPQFVSLSVNRWHFRCEAHSDCRVGSVSWDQFDVITRDVPRSDLREFHENNLMQWYRFFGGSLVLRERLLLTLLQLCSIFGVTESRGTILRVALSHKDLAGLVGATRPRVTEHIAAFERERLLIRQGRQMIVRLDKVERSISNPPHKTHGSFTRAGAQPQFPRVGHLHSQRSNRNSPDARIEMRE